jgi:hypothetical protein
MYDGRSRPSIYACDRECDPNLLRLNARNNVRVQNSIISLMYHISESSRRLEKKRLVVAKHAKH